MKAYIISDNNDSLEGMKMAGIDGVVVRSREDALSRLNYARKQGNIGIIIFTERAADFIREELEAMRAARTADALIVEIQDRHGSRKGSDRIAKYMKESIGLKI